MGFFDFILKKKTKKELDGNKYSIINGRRYRKNNKKFIYEAEYNYLKRYQFYRTTNIGTEKIPYKFGEFRRHLFYFNIVKNKITNFYYIEHRSLVPYTNHGFYKIIDSDCIRLLDKCFKNIEIFHDPYLSNKVFIKIFSKESNYEELDAYANDKKIFNFFIHVNEYMGKYYLEYACSSKILNIIDGVCLNVYNRSLMYSFSIFRNKMNNNYMIFDLLKATLTIIYTENHYIDYFEKLFQLTNEYVKMDEFEREYEQIIKNSEKDFKVVVLDDIGMDYRYRHNFYSSASNACKRAMEKRRKQEWELENKAEHREQIKDSQNKLRIRSSNNLNTV